MVIKLSSAIHTCDVHMKDHESELYGPHSNYSQTSLIRTPKGQTQVSALNKCPEVSVL